MNSNTKQPDRGAAATVIDPLWSLTCILADVARRVERRRAAEYSLETPETRRAAGGDPAACGEAA